MALLSLSSNVKKTVLIVTSLMMSLSVSAATLKDNHIDRLKRDMKIMKTILDTSLAEQTKSRPRVKSVYLAGQGMLFTIEQGGGFHFELSDFDFGASLAPAIAPLAPKPPVAPEGDVEHDIYMSEETIEQIEEYAMQAAESAMHMADMSLEYMSDVDWSGYTSAERSEQKAEQTLLRNEKRELEREARQLEREVRVIERKLRDSQFEQQLEDAETDAKLTEKLKNKMSGLTEALSEVAEKLRTNAGKLQQRAKKVKAEQEKKQKERLEKTEQLISETVCDFGSGLRSLPDGEHMTFQIEGRSNRLYVFEKDSVMACGQGDINAEQMLKNAVSYTM